MSKKKPSTVPRLLNVADLKATPRTPTLVHFSDEQWRAATRGAKAARSLRKGQPYVEYTPLPDGGGIVHVDCGSPSPDEECMARPVIDMPVPPPRGPRPRPGPGPDPGPEIGLIPERAPVRWECRCRPKNGPGLPTPAPRPACELVVDRWPRFRIRCANNSCGRGCALRIVRTTNGRFQLACVCS